jgi:hypothetical protein
VKFPGMVTFSWHRGRPGWKGILHLENIGHSSAVFIKNCLVTGTSRSISTGSGFNHDHYLSLSIYATISSKMDTSQTDRDQETNRSDGFLYNGCHNQGYSLTVSPAHSLPLSAMRVCAAQASSIFFRTWHGR